MLSRPPESAFKLVHTHMQAYKCQCQAGSRLCQHVSHATHVVSRNFLMSSLSMMPIQVLFSSESHASLFTAQNTDTYYKSIRKAVAPAFNSSNLK